MEGGREALPLLFLGGDLPHFKKNSLQSSPAPATSGSGGGAWAAAPPYQSPDYPSGGPSTPNNSRVPPQSSSNSSKLAVQDKGAKSSSSSQPLSQKQQMELLSPHNSELPKASSISSLRDALMATTSTASSSQQYSSYSSPRMGEHQASPMTPSTNLPVTPESGLVVSPQVSMTGAARQDSQLSSSGQSMDQDSSQPYSRQNSSRVKGDGSNPSQSVEDGSHVSPLHVESILGIKDDQPIDPPLSNSRRDAGGGTGSNVNSPHTQSPLGSMLTPNVVDGQSPVPTPGRPELLGFPAKSPSFRSTENQPSPLTEDGKTVSWPKNKKEGYLTCGVLCFSLSGSKDSHVTY